MNTESPEQIRKAGELKPGAIDLILNHPKFEENYRAATKLPAKYSIATALIEDGRYQDPLFLLRNFIPQDQPIDLDDRPFDTKEAKELKEDLAFLLLQKGIISPKAKDAKEAEEHLGRELENNQNMKDLALSGLPIEVLGQILTLEKFSQVSNVQKLEEFRSWTTHAMLRWYLGTLAGEMPKRELSVAEIMDRIPREIFRNPYALRYNLIENHFEKILMKHITDTGIENGFKTVEEIIEATIDQDRREFMKKVYERLYDIATFPLKGNFKEKILVKGQERSFPSFEQRAFSYDFIHHDTRLLAADTGLGKTAAAYLAMENSKATKVLVVAPANGRETWEIEEGVVFQKTGNVFVVDKSSDLDNASIVDKKYIVIGQELLGRCENDPKLAERLDMFISKTKIDGMIIDEIDNLSNPSSYVAKKVISIVSKIGEYYQEKNGVEETPILGLTATPIRKSLADLNVPMAILYPKTYAPIIGEETANRKTFSDTYLNNPHLTYIALTGERRMFRWETASGVQELAYKTIPIEISPFEQLLYEFIGEEVQVDAINKIRLLEDALLNPLLVKAEVRTLANGKIPEVDIDEALNILKQAALNWKELKNIDQPQSDDDYLSADKLVELGFGDLVLNCFFSETFENGVDTLVDELTKSVKDEGLETLRKFWRPMTLSSKYQYLKNILLDSLGWKVDGNGNLSRNKVMVISPTKRQGRTGDVLQREIDGRNLYREYELDTINDSQLSRLIRGWVDKLCKPENVLILDGTVPIGRQRNLVINKWVNTPEDAVLHANLKAIYQSRDFTITSTEDEYGRKINGLTKIFLHWPWYWQQFRQMVGRSQRQGQVVPVNTIILEAKDLIDQGKGEVVRYTNLLSRIALSGGTLAPEDQEFFDSKRIGRNRIRFQSIEKRYLRDVFNIVRGAGEDEVEQFMNEIISGQEKKNYELFAERFFDEGADEFRTSGYNAELVATLLKNFGLRDSKILSIGAGTLLLQRKLERGIDNIDMNPYIMKAGWKVASKYGGRMVVARASSLSEEEFPDGFYDAIDNSFALQWSRLGNEIEDSERVKILSQFNRLLKNNGKLVLTVPEGAFDEEKFRTFIKCLESSFGIRVDSKYSGKSYGISKLGSIKRLGWCIVGEKIGDINLENLNLSDLEFYNERNEWISHPGKKKNGLVVKSGDYPSPTIRLKFDRYQIVGENNEATDISLSAEPVVVFDAALSALRGETREEYESYKKDLIRELIDETGLNWEKAEELAIQLYEEMVKNGQKPTSRLRAYRLIRKKAKDLKNLQEGR